MNNASMLEDGFQTDSVRIRRRGFEGGQAVNEARRRSDIGRTDYQDGWQWLKQGTSSGCLLE